ncbi:MAG: 1-acyl-sn-glycerol-3-phosphate acyltransferase [Saprospiraceae bacterium]|nr:1-acyl-sn-glycerol-3-phosphate acyltransferase [Candidatus Brachybacter algidus]
MNIFYPILKKVVGIYLRFCYKRIYSNKFNELPDNTPIMLACNHNNAFSDALFVGSYLSDLDMNFITRGDVFNPKMMWFFNLTNQIPIFRFRDGYENLKKNNNSLEFCYKALGKNQRIIIFSEGDCITEKRLRHLQKGTARMAFGAYETSGVDNLVIYPVGINYIEPHNFRSSVLMSQGEPMYLADYIPTYNENPNKAIKMFTDELEARLKKEVLHINEKENEDLVQTALEIIDNEYPSTFFSLAKDGVLFKKMKSWIERFNLEEKDPSSTWIQDLTELKTILKSGNVKTKWPFYGKSFMLNSLVFILLLPIGIPAQIYYYLPLFVSKLLTIKFKPKKEFFISIRIGITWAILVLWLLLTFILISLILTIKVGLIFVIIAPIIAKLGTIWWEARNVIIQKVRWSSIDDKDQDKAITIMSDLQLINE